MRSLSLSPFLSPFPLSLLLFFSSSLSHFLTFSLSLFFSFSGPPLTPRAQVLYSLSLCPSFSLSMNSLLYFWLFSFIVRFFPCPVLEAESPSRACISRQKAILISILIRRNSSIHITLLNLKICIITFLNDPSMDDCP